MSSTASGSGNPANKVDMHRLFAYIADLELEVDRQRKQGGYIRHEMGDGLRRIERLCDGPAAPREISSAVQDLASLLRDLHDPPGYHPAHDQVVPIAVRRLAELVFQWQRRLSGNQDAALRLELESDYVEWFPARLRHIFDNLFSNALKYRDTAKAESWVFLGLRHTDRAYEFRVSDNGLGLTEGEGLRAFELISRAAPIRDSGLGVGLPVVRILVEQCGGSMSVQSEAGRGTDFVLVLPRYDQADYLT